MNKSNPSLSSDHNSVALEECDNQPEDKEVTLSTLINSGFCNVIMY